MVNCKGIKSRTGIVSVIVTLLYSKIVKYLLKNL